MNRKEFDTLDPIDQVEYINRKLLEGKTVTSISKSICIGRSTIRDRFEKLGYKYNSNNKQYESYIEIIQVDDRDNKSTIKCVKQKSSNKVVGTNIDNNKILEQIIINYDKMNSKLDEMFSWYQLQINNKVVDTDKLKIDDFEGDIVVRSYKLYESIQKEFSDFCKKNNKYKVQDILSQALKEFLEKYN